MDRRLDVRLLQAVEASLQRSYEALPQVVHGADELIGHRLIQTNHYQVLDLVDAGFDLFGCNRISVGGYDDVCGRNKERNGITSPSVQGATAQQGKHVCTHFSAVNAVTKKYQKVTDLTHFRPLTDAYS